MSLSSAEIIDLYRRAQLALARGYTIARADYYAGELGTDRSTAAILAACRAAMARGVPAVEAKGSRIERREPALPKPPPMKEPPVKEPPVTAAKVEPTPPVPPKAPEPPIMDEAPEDDTADTYESWSKRKLLAAAAERGLNVTAHNTKAEIIAALRAL